MKTIFTIGHSNKSFEEFNAKLQEHNINVLIDVRTFPRSRFCPQFNEKRLADALLEQKITYLFKGKNLGGRGENIGYDEAIDEVISYAEAGLNVCVMCSEKDHLKCHRHEMLEPSFIERGCKVKHVQYD